MKRHRHKSPPRRAEPNCYSVPLITADAVAARFGVPIELLTADARFPRPVRLNGTDRLAFVAADIDAWQRWRDARCRGPSPSAAPP